MAGKVGAANSRRSIHYQALLDLLATGPKTRAYVIRELVKYVPFEKALRRVERERLRRWRVEHRKDPELPPPPRVRYKSLDEQIRFGQRAMVGEVIQTAVASGRVVIEKQPDAPKGGGGQQPHDILRLRRPGEISVRHQQRLKAQEKYKARRRAHYERRKRDRQEQHEEETRSAA